MRRAATHLAQVADGSGRVLGLVALEDVLEMLVGEVRDPAHRVRPRTATVTIPVTAPHPVPDTARARPSAALPGADPSPAPARS